MNTRNPGPLDTILFVDDEAKTRKYFTLIFGRHYPVLVAVDGEDAVKIYEAEHQRIGIVVTDQIMPRMTGLELLGRLRMAGSPVIRILSTAYADSDLVSAAVSEGLIDYFIGKPWNLEKFESLLQQSLSLVSHRQAPMSA